MEELRRYIPLYLRLVRAFCQYPAFLLVWVLCVSTMRGFGEDKYMHLAAAIALPFLFFSVARVFAEADAVAIKRYAEGGATGLLRRAKSILCTPYFWIDFAFVVAFVLILPFEAGLYHIAEGLGATPTTPRVPIKLAVLGVSLPVFWVLLLWARLSAWQKHTDGQRAAPGPEKGAPDMVMETVARAQWAAHSMGSEYQLVNEPTGTIDAAGRQWLRREGERGKHLAVQMLMLLGIYALGGFALYMTVPVFVSAWNILRALGTLRWWLPLLLLVALALGFWTWHVLRALYIRHKFFRSLRRLCREYGFRVEGKKRPYCSIFRYRDGVNFTIYANGKVYDCKLFSALRRHWDIFFDEHATMYCAHALRFRRVEFLRFTSEYHFDFESEHSKICVVSPVPKTIYAGNPQWHRPLDTGMKVGEFRIFSASGLLNALKRDCVEHD